MKRLVSALAIMLMLSICFVGTSFALEHPYNYSPETHPWGGDDIGSDPPPPTTKHQLNTYATGIFVVDVVFKYIILDDVVNINTGSRVQNALTRKYENQSKRNYSTLKKERIR